MNTSKAQSILVTCECAPNIALIKYWGKSDEHLILPVNSSISITLDKEILNTKTSFMLIQKQNPRENIRIRFWFGKQMQEFDENGRVVGNSECMEVKGFLNVKRFLRMLNCVIHNCAIQSPESYDIHICTKNNFPHAAGLASSASGYACLALCMAHAYKYKGMAEFGFFLIVQKISNVNLIR